MIPITYLQRLITNLKKEKNNHYFWMSLVAFSFFTLAALGRTNFDVVSYGLWLYVSFYVLKRLSNALFLCHLFVTFIIALIYLPVALSYGQVDIGVIASLLESNIHEATEYAGTISFTSYLCLLFYSIVLVLIIKLNKNYVEKKPKSKFFYLLFFVVIISIFEKPITNMFKTKSFIMNTTYYPIRHVVELYSMTRSYLVNKSKITQAMQLEPTWKFESVNPKYDTYVLVIGESMRRDYMSTYNYPIQSTPFLDGVNGIVFKDFISASYNTNLSLERMLFQHKKGDFGNINHANSIITFANTLNFDTYWLSNQDQYGSFDVLASSIGMKAQHINFLKTGKLSSQNISDLQLLPVFNEALNQKNNDKKNKLIVLHLMGSHSSFCKRLDDKYNIKNITGYISNDISCYLSSYKQTDKLLGLVYDNLKESEQSFSLMYLSDHGLAHKDKSMRGKSLSHNPKVKESYQVPLIIMSSDDTKRTNIDVQRSGYHFIHGFAEWLGVKEATLKLDKPFMSNDSIEVMNKRKIFNGNELVDYESLKDDPAITE